MKQDDGYFPGSNLTHTHLAAHIVGAPRVLANGGDRFFHQRVFIRAIEAGADHVETTRLEALAHLPLVVGGVVDQSLTVQALQRVAIGLVSEFLP